jgi:hypothetical protein
MPGRWVVEAPGASFSPWVFVRAPDGTFWYAPGTWRDAKGQTVEAPPSLAVAVVEGSEVVNADGSVETTGPTLRPARVRPAPAPPAAPPSAPP